jgi:hypothetical protein
MINLTKDREIAMISNCAENDEEIPPPTPLFFFHFILPILTL